MELENVLKYQAIDGEIKKLKKELMANENIKTAEETKRKFSEMKQIVVKNESIATKVCGGYDESLKLYEQSNKRAEELLAKLENEDIDDETAEKIVAELNEINENLAENSEFVSSLKKKGEDAVREYSVAQKNGHDLKTKYSAAKEEIKKLEEQFKPRLNKLQEELNEAKKNVEPKLLEIYEKISAENRYPVFAEVYVGDGNTMNCSMCGYSLSLNTQSELKSAGYCVCEKCHRIVYTKKK